MKSIVITGSSSGIGKATARYFAEQGWRVAATMRKPENETELNQIEGISLYALDVTDEASVANATQQILDDFGTVDVVFSNAGYAAAGLLPAGHQTGGHRIGYSIKHDRNTGIFCRCYTGLGHWRCNGKNKILF